MEIKQHHYYRAQINYHRTDDLKKHAAPNGEKVLVYACWVADDDERYSGDFIFSIARYIFNIPERDLEITQEIDLKTYVLEDEKGYLNEHRPIEVF